MIENKSGGSGDDDGLVDIEILQLSGDVIHTIENLYADATIGGFKARLRQAKIDFALWRCIVVAPESFEMADDYCKFMLTKAVKQATVHPEEGRNKLQVMVVNCCERLAASSDTSCGYLSYGSLARLQKKLAARSETSCCESVNEKLGDGSNYNPP